MEDCILVIDYDNSDLESSHRDWGRHDISLRVVHSIYEAIMELVERDFLFGAIFSKGNDFFTQLPLLRTIRPISILIFSTEYDVATILSLIIAHGFYDGLITLRVGLL